MGPGSDADVLHSLGAHIYQECYDCKGGVGKNFQSTSISAKIFIKKEFDNTKLGENDDADEHIHKLCHLYQDLKITGSNFPKSEFTSAILMSLPPSWDTFIASIDAEKSQKH